VISWVWILALTCCTALASGAWLWGWMRWLTRQTGEDRYFARPLEERRALKRAIRRRGSLVLPILVPVARIFRLRIPTSEYRETRAPALACPRAAFRQAARYQPMKGDVFVATQMKCGTTWAQQIAYEALSRGRGNLGDDGHRHMYALSPWIESRASVSLERAPRVGERGHRIIKTHFAVNLCPYDEAARYIYVTRHPVACFASCIDFVRMLSGPLAPPLPELVDWFCSDSMWWRSWPEHVEGWWRWQVDRPNVLFLHYEDMLDDLAGAVDRVAELLEVDLLPDERAEVVRKSGYGYMKKHEEAFEMSPPSFLTADGGTFFQSGRKDRDRAIDEADRTRIARFCRQRLEGGAYPLARFYPDVASA
jgi:hypothetical protein